MRRFLLLLVALSAAFTLASPAFAGPKFPRVERKAVDRTINAFVLHAVRHKNPGAAYKLLSPAFRDGLTRKEFARQDPVFPYPARGTKFPWTLQYVEPREIGGIIMLQPRRGAKIGPIVFDLRLTKHHGQWLIESLIPSATFGTPTNPRVRSVRDYSPGAALGAEPNGTRGRISGEYAVIPFAGLGALFAGLAVWGLLRWRRDRRITASVRARDARARATN